jgi:hypothetical protein
MNRENRMNAIKIAAATLLLVALAPVARADKAPDSGPPAAVRKILDQMAGTWTTKDALVQLGPKQMKVSSKVVCEKAAAGWALQCKLRVDLPGMTHDEVDMLGWDEGSNSFHLYSVDSSGVAHDHKGAVGTGGLELAYAGSKDGKPFDEKLSFTFKGPRELVWKDVSTVGGEPHFSGEAVYRK